MSKSEKLKIYKAIGKDLESEIQVLRNKIERLESMGLFQFIKKRYLTKKS